MTPGELLEAVTAFLEASRTATLATVDEAGRPHAANVQFAVDGMALVWASRPEAAHSRHVERAGLAALTVYAHVSDPGQIHGVQVHAEVERAIPARARPIYTARFAALGEAKLARMLEGHVLYRAEPTWLRWIDNRRAFGFKREWRRGEG